MAKISGHRFVEDCSTGRMETLVLYLIKQYGSIPSQSPQRKCDLGLHVGPEFTSLNNLSFTFCISQPFVNTIPMYS